MGVLFRGNTRLFSLTSPAVDQYVVGHTGLLGLEMANGLGKIRFWSQTSSTKNLTLCRIPPIMRWVSKYILETKSLFHSYLLGKIDTIKLCINYLYQEWLLEAIFVITKQYFILYEFFRPILTGGFSLKSEWQVSLWALAYFKSAVCFKVTIFPPIFCFLLYFLAFGGPFKGQKLHLVPMSPSCFILSSVLWKDTVYVYFFAIFFIL